MLELDREHLKDRIQLLARCWVTTAYSGPKALYANPLCERAAPGIALYRADHISAKISPTAPLQFYVYTTCAQLNVSLRATHPLCILLITARLTLKCKFRNKISAFFFVMSNFNTARRLFRYNFSISFHETISFKPRYLFEFLFWYQFGTCKIF